MEARKPDSPSNPFDQLPLEILYYIFDFLPPRTIHYSLKLVCKKFCSLLTTDKYFKGRLMNKHLKSKYKYPFLDWYGLHSNEPFRQGMDVSWEDMAVRLDMREYIWGYNSIIEHRIFSVPHNTCVDTVRLLQNGRLCISGGRDKSLCLWDTEQILYPDPVLPVAIAPDAHDAWVWAIAENEPDVFYTSGWDHNVKEWSVRSDSLDLLQTFRLNRPSMCLASTRGMLAVGMNSGTVVLLDPRISETHNSHNINVHTGVITAMNMWNNHILTVGEDKRMGVTDVRALRPLFCQSVPGASKTCLKSSGVHRGMWYIGDTKGTIHVLDSRSDYKLVMRVKTTTDRAINSLVPSLEGIIVGTYTGIEVILPSKPKQVLNEFNCSGEVTSIDLKKNVLVAGCSNSRKCVHVFKPIL